MAVDFAYVKRWKYGKEVSSLEVGVQIDEVFLHWQRRNICDTGVEHVSVYERLRGTYECQQ